MTVFLYAFSHLHVIFVQGGEFPHSYTCNWQIRIGNFLYFSSNCGLYLCLVGRIRAVAAESNFVKNSKFFKNGLFLTD